MADRLPDWLAAIPPELHEPLRRTAAGLPANVAVMGLLIECADAGAAEEALEIAGDRLEASGQQQAAARLLEALRLLRANPAASQTVRSVLSGLDHNRHADGEDDIRYWAAAFDKAAQQNAEASVALYSLGNADLLDAATGEIVDWLQKRGLISPATACLDIGCGIGRFERALAPLVGRIVGIDISGEMVALAGQRCAALPNVGIRRASGRDLAGFGDGSFDLVLAVDAFPYIVQSGASSLDVMLAECARVLRRGGRLAILNFSYRGDVERDHRDLQAFAGREGLELVHVGTSEFSLWDGHTFDLKKL